MKFIIFFKICLTSILLLSLLGCNSSINKFGLYKSYLPNFSLELQSNGTVFLTPKQGSRIYCSTRGSWIEVNENTINLSLEINSGCEWVNDLSGSWTLRECKKIEGDKTYCLEKGIYKLIKN